ADFTKAIEVQPDFAEAHGGLGLVLQSEGRFTEALAARRRAHELGAKRPDWTQPSAAWVSEAERVVELDKRLPAVLAGADKVAGPAERLEFAKVCYWKQLVGVSARFYEEAFAAQPDLAHTPTGHRYAAAAAAALAGCGQGKDDPPLDEATRARWRAKAQDWL